MAIFPYKVRSREQWEARANSSGDFEGWLKDEYRIYKPQPKENCVRILPPSPEWENPPHYGMDVWVHYSVGPDKAAVICLFRMKKGNCPICEERARYERAKDEEKARELRPTKRVLVFVINRKDEQQGPLAWGMAKTLDDGIGKVARDRSTGEYYFVDHPTDGYDIYFDKEGEGLLTKYTGVTLAKKMTAAPESALDWLVHRPIPDALRWRTYEEVKRLFTGTGRGEAPEDEGGAPVIPIRGRRAPAAERDDDPDPEYPPRRARREEPEEDRRPRRNTAEEIDDEVPPFDTDDKPKAESKPAPSGDGKARAADLRQRFGITD